MRRLRRVVLWTPVVLAVLWAVLGFVAVPRVLRSQLPDKLGAALKRPVTVGEIAFNPFTLELDLHDFAVTERNGDPLLSFHRLRVDASFFALIHGKVGLDAIAIEKPHVALTVHKDGALSIADLFAPAPGEKKTEASQPTAISVTRFTLADGALTFRDLSRPEPFSTTLQPLSLELDDFTTATGHDSRYAFKAKMGSAELDYDGELSLSPLKSSGKLSMKGIGLPALQPYLDGATQLELLHGVLAISGHYDFDGSAFVLEGCELDVDGLKVGAEKQALLELKRLSAHASRIDLKTRKVQLTKILLDGGVVRARRGADGQVDLVRLAGPRLEPIHQAVVSGPQWTAHLDSLALESWHIDWADESLEYPSRIDVDKLNLELKHLSWPNPGPLDVSLALRWQEAGSIKVSGTVAPEPFAADLKLALDKVSLIALDGYAWQNGFNGTLEHAKLSTALDVHVGKDVSAKGDVRVEDISLLDGDDRPLLAARMLTLTGLDYRSAPIPTVNLDTLALSGVHSKISRDEKGVVNLARLRRETKALAAAAAPASAGPAFSTFVKQLVFDDTNVDWLDKATSPPFSSSTSRLAGRFTNITLPVTRPIGVQVAGRINQAPTTMSGMVLPRVNATEADLKFTIEGYDLPHATPYAVKYVAQPINTGKLVISLDAKLKQQKLDAQTHLVIDTLEFGETLETPGPEAKSLPLGLAVAVLSDRDGRIELTLPVTGDMSAPDFQWGGVLWQVVINLMEKVASAPLGLVRHLFAENGHEPEQLKALAFPPGRAAPEDIEAAKLDSIAKLLTERPRLKLHLVPGVDRVADRDALARESLRRSFLAQAERGAGGEQADGGTTPALTQADYERLVHAAWAKKASGRADAGTRPFSEKEAELLAAQHVPQEDLDALAGSRAEWCQSTLQDHGVPMTRVFVVDPDGDKGTRAQVDIDVK